jgi:N-methylhydantoinase A
LRPMAQAIGIDVGGTFVDVVIASETGIRIAKEPSTPGEPALGVLRALDRLMGAGWIVPQDVRGLAHGCTVATNALLEGKWARTALITTRGFRDVLEIGRQHRHSLYDFEAVRPPAMVSRDLRFEVTERVTSDGEVETPLDVAELRKLAEGLRGANVAAVAVVFLFSYLHPEHERAARDVLAGLLELPVVLSSDVLPEMREYERTSTTVISAALRPVIGAYLTALEDGGAERGLPRAWRVMQSSGAVTTLACAQEQPASLLLSGPAGGVQGARAVGAAMGERNLITMDMGGTSCDVALITDGAIERTRSGMVGSYPVALPMVSVHTLGAGGGSVAWVDRGGALRVGPESMGATPGPACYGRGGRATVTDAHLVLGHLVAHQALGGLPPLDTVAARRAIAEDVGQRLGLSVERAALGVLEVADAAMERAIRVVTVERGRDPRDYALLAFGGAGPLHGASIARRLGIPRVVVPWMAGVLSAFGLVVAETGHDVSQSIVVPFRRLQGMRISETVGALRARGTAALRAEGIREDEMQLVFSADVRYVGQAHELTVPLETRGDNVDVVSLRRAFEEAHEVRYGHGSPSEEAELVTLRLRAQGPPLFLAGKAKAAGQEEGSGVDRPHDVWFDAAGPMRGRLRSRSSLVRGGGFRGPLVVVGEDSTILVPPDARGLCDAEGHMILEVG